MRIVYSRSQREEDVATLAALKKVVGRFIAHRVFYEMSARQRKSRQLYSVKNSFTVGQIAVEGDVELVVTIFDAHNASHSIEIVNPHTLRVYDENPNRGFAVAFYAEEDREFDVRYYLRDEGEDERAATQTALERITLPQLFEYLQDITNADVVDVTSAKN